MRRLAERSPALNSPSNNPSAPYEYGAVPLACVGKVASWRRPSAANRNNWPMVVIMESSGTEDAVYEPAASVTILGRDQLLALRSAIDEALKTGESQQG